MVRVGVYDQGVIAVKLELDVAKKAAETSAAGERDSYHDFEIRIHDPNYDEFCQTIWTFSAVPHGNPRAWLEVKE